MPSRFAEAAAEAAIRIADVICETPVVRSAHFSEVTGADVHFKLENRQHTGSFKLRGAANCLLSLSPGQRARGVATASSGNHGAAVAYAMRALDVPGVIFVPEQTSEAKVEAIRSYGGDVRFFGTDGLDTELHAREYAESEGLFYVSPYNDANVVAGQGTCGIEIADQCANLDAVFVAVGGGGLLGGVGSVLRRRLPDIRIFACQPEASAVMAKSVEAGRVLDLPSQPTLSDGTAGGVEANAITFDLCRELADEFVLVSEDEIAAAMRAFIGAEKDTIEGSAGVAIAALERRREVIEGRKVLVIICGGNVSEATLEAVCGS
ncbi:MAG: threonine/serine dehydratase [Woeseiaceae bacterium]|nr:threonine/serine dehydratase [Woeseiaceae bacterium]